MILRIDLLLLPTVRRYLNSDMAHVILYKGHSPAVFKIIAFCRMKFIEPNTFDNRVMSFVSLDWSILGRWTKLYENPNYIYFTFNRLGILLVYLVHKWTILHNPETLDP